MYTYGLCLHTPRADCNFTTAELIDEVLLCLHTLRADCNRQRRGLHSSAYTLPPHAPCRLQHAAEWATGTLLTFASTRSVQIATPPRRSSKRRRSFASTRSVQIATKTIYCSTLSLSLCLHTLRADCNYKAYGTPQEVSIFASTRSVQIATGEQYATTSYVDLCLHTLRADCNWWCVSVRPIYK